MISAAQQRNPSGHAPGLKDCRRAIIVCLVLEGLGVVGIWLGVGLLVIIGDGLHRQSPSFLFACYELLENTLDLFKDIDFLMFLGVCGLAVATIHGAQLWALRRPRCPERSNWGAGLGVLSLPLMRAPAVFLGLTACVFAMSRDWLRWFPSERTMIGMLALGSLALAGVLGGLVFFNISRRLARGERFEALYRRAARRAIVVSVSLAIIGAVFLVTWKPLSWWSPVMVAAVSSFLLAAVTCILPYRLSGELARLRAAWYAQRCQRCLYDVSSAPVALGKRVCPECGHSWATKPVIDKPENSSSPQPLDAESDAANVKPL